MWLFDVRDSVGPSARLEGFDISFDAAPPAGTLPTNVSLRHWNVNQELPEDLVGQFDIVHVRFFAFVLMNEQVQPVVERLFKMLSTSTCSIMHLRTISYAGRVSEMVSANNN